MKGKHHHSSCHCQTCERRRVRAKAQALDRLKRNQAERDQAARLLRDEHFKRAQLTLFDPRGAR